MNPLILSLEDVKLLEPAVVGTDLEGPHEVRPEHMLFSIAVSLKRIADNTQKVEVNITTDFSAMHGDITNMAWEAGRSFQHGTRTDR